MLNIKNKVTVSSENLIFLLFISPIVVNYYEYCAREWFFPSNPGKMLISSNYNTAHCGEFS